MLGRLVTDYAKSAGAPAVDIAAPAASGLLQSEARFGLVVVAALFVSGGVVLQVLVTYGTTLGFIYYKSTHLGPEFAKVLTEDPPQTVEVPARFGPPLIGVEIWRDSPSTTPIFPATAVMLLAYFVVAFAGLWSMREIVATPHPMLTGATWLWSLSRCDPGLRRRHGAWRPSGVSRQAPEPSRSGIQRGDVVPAEIPLQQGAARGACGVLLALVLESSGPRVINRGCRMQTPSLARDIA